MSVKDRVAVVLEAHNVDDKGAVAASFTLSGLIAINAIGMMVETLPGLSPGWMGLLRWIDLVSVSIFSLEYLARVWSATSLPGFQHPVLGRLRYMLTPLAIIDLVAILPALLSFGIDLRSMRALRLLRLARVLKLGRYSSALQLLARVVHSKREPLLASLFVLGILLIVSSSLMYYAENAAQPAAFPSIPAALWWGVATLSTVGYGDIYPVTAMGKLVGSVVAVLGIGMFALPAGLLGSGFVTELAAKSKPSQCPHCGGVVHPES